MSATSPCWVVYAEQATNSTPDARPEGFIVALSMVLYVLWDFFGFRVLRDPLSRMALGGKPSTKYGPRRKVTLACMVASVALAIVAFSWESLRRDTGLVIWFDVALIVLLLLYRVFKSTWDDNIKARAESRPKAALIRFADWQSIVPRAVALDWATLAEVAAKDPEFKNSDKPAPTGFEIPDGNDQVCLRVRAAIARLSEAGAVQMALRDNKEIATLTKAGLAYAQPTDSA